MNALYHTHAGKYIVASWKRQQRMSNCCDGQGVREHIILKRTEMNIFVRAFRLSKSIEFGLLTSDNVVTKPVLGSKGDLE